jgi:GTP:adenosylcobinamide-phosphate guanylyltransferase
MESMVLIVVAAISLFKSEPLAEFIKAGNGNPVYKFVPIKECETGKRESGFALAPTGIVVLKQLNHDGTVGDVCEP